MEPKSQEQATDRPHVRPRDNSPNSTLNTSGHDTHRLPRSDFLRGRKTTLFATLAALGTVSIWVIPSITTIPAVPYSTTLLGLLITIATITIHYDVRRIQSTTREEIRLMRRHRDQARHFEKKSQERARTIHSILAELKEHVRTQSQSATHLDKRMGVAEKKMNEHIETQISAVNQRLEQLARNNSVVLNDTTVMKNELHKQRAMQNHDLTTDSHPETHFTHEQLSAIERMMITLTGVAAQGRVIANPMPGTSASSCSDTGSTSAQ